MDKQLKNLIIIYVVCGIPLLIIVLTRKNQNDLKKQKKSPSCGGTGPWGANLNVRFPLFWLLSHFIMYFFIGYFAPKYWFIATILGYLFEHFEKYLHDHHDMPIYHNLKGDILANSLGLLCGIVSRLS